MVFEPEAAMALFDLSVAIVFDIELGEESAVTQTLRMLLEGLFEIDTNKFPFFTWFSPLIGVGYEK